MAELQSVSNKLDNDFKTKLLILGFATRLEACAILAHGPDVDALLLMAHYLERHANKGTPLRRVQNEYGTYLLGQWCQYMAAQ